MARTPTLVTLPGSDAYGDYLDRLIAEADRRGHRVETRAGIVEFALNKLGMEWGLAPPHRARPVGANQHDPGPADPED